MKGAEAAASAFFTPPPRHYARVAKGPASPAGPFCWNGPYPFSAHHFSIPAKKSPPAAGTAGSKARHGAEEDEEARLSLRVHLRAENELEELHGVGQGLERPSCLWKTARSDFRLSAPLELPQIVGVRNGTAPAFLPG
jgi:hypothetical protein